MFGALHFHCRGTGAIPGGGTKIPRAKQHGRKKRNMGLGMTDRSMEASRPLGVPLLSMAKPRPVPPRALAKQKERRQGSTQT